MIRAMRRALALSCLFPLTVFACFSQGSSGGGGPTFDAAADITAFDTSTPDVTEEPAVTETGVDAPVEATVMEDSGVQDVVSEPAGPVVTVTVISTGGAEQGVLVVFQDGAGNVLGTPTTDVNGVASLGVPAGSSVSVLMGSAGAANLYTVLGVTPGMSFVVPDWAGAPSTNVQLTSVPSPVPDGGVEFFWYTGGFATMQFPSVPFQESLSVYGAQPAYGIGHHGSTVGAALPTLVESVTAGGAVMGWAGVKDQPLGPLDDAGLLEVNVPGPWNTSVFMQNLALDTGDSGASANGGSYLQESVDGVLLPLWGPPYNTHPGYADFAQAEADFGQQIVVTRVPSPTASGTVTIDASNIGSIPHLLSGTASATAGQPAISWTTSPANPTGLTGVVAQASWSSTLPDGGSASGYWTVVAPVGTSSSVTAPALPAALAAYGPLAQTSMSLVSMWLVTGQTGIPTYADLVGMAGYFFPVPASGCVSGPFSPPLPANGTAAISLTPNPTGGC
jgi:hypothetical protein